MYKYMALYNLDKWGLYNHRYYTYRGLAMSNQKHSDISNPCYGLYAHFAQLLDALVSSVLLGERKIA